jgi:tetratricopeptide (TPR) repeat protein
MSRRERRAAARIPQKNSQRSGPHTPAALFEAGVRHMRAGHYLDAQVCCQQALAADSNHADTLHLMGLLSLQAKQYDHAVEWIARAIRQNPKPLYLWSLGTTLQQQGRPEEALKAFDKAVQLKPDDAESWKNLGNVLVELKRPAEALSSFQQALKLNPRHWDAANKSGFLLHELGRLEEAVAHFNLCEKLQPNHAPTLHMRAISLRGLKRCEESLADNRRAHALDPTNADTCNNTGDALQSLGRYEEALGWFDRALELRPDFAEAFDNKAVGLVQLHRFDQAFAIHDHLKNTGINTALTDWNLSLLHMLTGNFEAGWAGRETRWQPPLRPPIFPEFSQPMWLGEQPIDGKTILIHVDEGLGDTIQFVRYVPMVAALGARVILVLERPLYPLLSGLSGVSQCVAFGSGPLPAFDMYCSIGSLPLAFATRLDTIPSTTSYLPPVAEARVEAWEQRLEQCLGPHDKLRVGLVWSGSLGHNNDRNRSTSLRVLSGLLDVDARFISLQKDPRPDDKIVLAQTDIVDLTAHLTDFAETAALIGCLDLVITVDTSVAHLAGALGCPTWILLPRTPDYRWLLDRDDSPWYPTVRLFRQDETRDYADVLDRVRSALLILAEGFVRGD